MKNTGLNRIINRLPGIVSQNRILFIDLTKKWYSELVDYSDFSFKISKYSNCFGKSGQKRVRFCLKLEFPIFSAKQQINVLYNMQHIMKLFNDTSFVPKQICTNISSNT